MATQTRKDGETPNGGAYSIAYWQDDKGQPADEAEATRVEIIEFDADGEQVFRTYATIGTIAQSSSRSLLDS